MSLDDKWKDIIMFNNKFFPNWRNEHEIYYSNALAGECGELCNAVKHRLNGGTNKKDVSNYDLMLELADIFIYLSILIEINHVDNILFASIINDKININKERMKKIGDKNDNSM